MSEKIPVNHNKDKEPKPLRDDCMRCEEEYDLTPENTFGVVYETDSHCNHLYVTCPCCGFEYTVFASSHLIDRAVEHNIAFNPKIRVRDPETNDVIETYQAGGKYAPVPIVSMWQQLKDMELVEPVEISPRHEELIPKFGETITAMLEADPDGFWEDINSPHDHKPYTLRWN